MLSGEGKENENKTTIGLISKNTSLHVQHLFLYISLPLFCNVKLPSYAFYGGNVVRVFFSFTFFFCCRSFSPWWPLGFLILSPPLQNFHVVLPTINGSLSLALAPCCSFSRWASLVCLLLSLFLCPSPALYSKFVDMTIDLSLKL